MEKHNTTHQENLEFIAQSLQNKPVTASRIKQALEYSANNAVGAKIVFPDLPIPTRMEFTKEHQANHIFVKPDDWTEEDFNNLDKEDLKD